MKNILIQPSEFLSIIKLVLSKAFQTNGATKVIKITVFFWLILFTFQIQHLFGQQLNWAYKFGKPKREFANTMTVDNNNNVIAAGIFKGKNVDFDGGTGHKYLSSDTNNMFDIFVIKYAKSGNLSWAFSISSSHEDYIAAVTTDESGNIYLTGVYSEDTDFDPGPGSYILSNNTNWDFVQFIAKYDSSSNLLWVKSIINMGGYFPFGSDGFYDCIIDNQNNLVCLGLTSYGSNQYPLDLDPSINNTNLVLPTRSIIVAKYDSAGNYLNYFSLNRDGIQSHVNRSNGMKIRVDNSNNYYVSFNNRTSNIDLDPSPNNLIITSDNNSYFDFGIAKFDTSYQLVWYNFVSDTMNVWQRIVDFAIKDSLIYCIIDYNHFSGDIDPGSSVIQFSGNGNVMSLLGIYDLNNTLKQVLHFDGSDNLATQMLDISVGKGNELFISGLFWGDTLIEPISNQTLICSSCTGATGPHYNFVIKYDSLLSLSWLDALDPYTCSADINFIAPDNDNGVYIFGEFVNQADFDFSNSTYLLNAVAPSDLFLACYDDSPVIQGIYPEIPTSDFGLYFNSSNESINIKCKEPSLVNVRVYDSFGRLVFAEEMTLNSHFTEIPFSHTANGIYFVSVLDHKNQGTFKIVK